MAWVIRQNVIFDYKARESLRKWLAYESKNGTSSLEKTI
jgi:hypothetical protein